MTDSGKDKDAQKKKKSGSHISIHSRHFVAKGDLAIKQGDTGNEAYLIQSGKMRVFVEENGKQVDVAELGPGQIFGEMALIVNEPRAASVEALENSNLIILTRPMIKEKLARSDPTVRALVPMLMTRIKDANASALRKSENFDDMVEAINKIYKSIEAGLGPQKKASLEKAVKPQMDEFIKAIAHFQSLYADN